MKKKKIIFTTITIILLIVVIFLTYILLRKIILKNGFEDSLLSFTRKNETKNFKIEKITFFSSCDAQNKTATTSSFTIENLYQYTDMAFFITTPDTEKNLSNTLKKVYINNFKYEKAPSIGEPKLYYKNIQNFAKSDILENNLINNTLNFEITSNDEASLDTPTLYNNLANPIVLSYVNTNIKNDYTLTDITNPVTYDGSLLKTCGVLINDITSRISFDVYIVNNLDQEFKCTVYTDIPLKTEEKSIYDGNLTLSQNTNFTFYRYK